MGWWRPGIGEGVGAVVGAGGGVCCDVRLFSLVSGEYPYSGMGCILLCGIWDSVVM